LASAAVHVTLVVPTGNVLPLAGAHTTLTGKIPPEVLAAPYTTLAPCCWGATTGVGAAGQRIFGPGVGPTVELESPQLHAGASTARTKIPRKMRRLNKCESFSSIPHAAELNPTTVNRHRSVSDPGV